MLIDRNLADFLVRLHSNLRRDPRRGLSYGLSRERGYPYRCGRLPVFAFVVRPAVDNRAPENARFTNSSSYWISDGRMRASHRARTPEPYPVNLLEGHRAPHFFTWLSQVISMDPAAAKGSANSSGVSINHGGRGGRHSVLDAGRTAP
jgi:hypothetical protein